MYEVLTYFLQHDVLSAELWAKYIIIIRQVEDKLAMIRILNIIDIYMVC